MQGDPTNVLQLLHTRIRHETAEGVNSGWIRDTDVNPLPMSVYGDGYAGFKFQARFTVQHLSGEALTHRFYLYKEQDNSPGWSRVKTSTIVVAITNTTGLTNWDSTTQTAKLGGGLIYNNVNFGQVDAANSSPSMTWTTQNSEFDLEFGLAFLASGAWPDGTTIQFRPYERDSSGNGIVFSLGYFNEITITMKRSLANPFGEVHVGPAVDSKAFAGQAVTAAPYAGQAADSIAYAGHAVAGANHAGHAVDATPAFKNEVN